MIQQLRVPAVAEGCDLPGGAAAADVHPADQGIVGQALSFARPGCGDTLAVDELEFVVGIFQKSW
jgi:hypothetical protein